MNSQIYLFRVRVRVRVVRVRVRVRVRVNGHGRVPSTSGRAAMAWRSSQLDSTSKSNRFEKKNHLNRTKNKRNTVNYVVRCYHISKF